jgi:hypothetical protein
MQPELAEVELRTQIAGVDLSYPIHDFEHVPNVEVVQEFTWGWLDSLFEISHTARESRSRSSSGSHPGP